MVSLLKKKLDITLGCKQLLCELTARENGLEQAQRAEEFQKPMIEDRFFMHTGMEEHELWDHMTKAKTQPGFV